MAMIRVYLLIAASVVSAQLGCNKAVQEKCQKKFPDLEASVCLTVKCPNATVGTAAFNQRMLEGHNEYR